MSRQKQPEAASMDVATFHKRIAWYIRHQCHQEANALRELAPYFEPPIRVDEKRVDRLVAELAANADRIWDPVNWS